MDKRKNGTFRTFSLRRLVQQSLDFSRRNHTIRNLNKNDVEIGLPTISKGSSNKLNSESQISQISFNDSIKDGVFCPICYSFQSMKNMFCLEMCSHKFCLSCLENYLKHEISESRINIACPQCSSGIHPNNIAVLLAKIPDYRSKYEDFMLRKYLVSDPDSRWCPAPDCGFAIIAHGCASCPQLRCQMPNCGVSFCYHCKEVWHPDQTCDSAKISRKKMRHASNACKSYDSFFNDEIKPCPKCQVYIVKMNDGSCNHMVCSLCKTEFCWLCMKEVNDVHYLSPSGCTFWGKKPWSKRKKVLWQIGTMIGAPVCIALLAGIAIPSIIIGVPVWVGKKLLERYKTVTKKKKMLSVALGIIASIIIAPFFAGLAIAVGIPFLFFYVYGIVPVSLFRATFGENSPNIYKCNEESHKNTLDSTKSAAIKPEGVNDDTDGFCSNINSEKNREEPRKESKVIFKELNSNSVENL